MPIARVGKRSGCALRAPTSEEIAAASDNRLPRECYRRSSAGCLWYMGGDAHCVSCPWQSWRPGQPLPAGEP